MIQEIEAILRQRQLSVTDLENIIYRNRVKIKKITTQLDKEEAKLIDLVVELTDTSSTINTVDDGLLSPQELTSRLNEINTNLRKIRLNLADIIRKK